MNPPLVVIESPFSRRPDGTRSGPGEVQRNVDYLRECMRDSFARGEHPFASHGLYPGALDDTIDEQRRMGMEAGLAWGEKADYVVVYEDHGITTGMQVGIARAQARGQRVEHRRIRP